MKKKMAAISMAMALILGLTACGAANESVPSETAAVPAESAAPSEAAIPEPAASDPQEADPRAGKLIWSTPQSLTSADAYMWDVSGDIQIHTLCLEGLMEHVGWNKYEPALATGWDITPDLLTYTFHLREGVKFHSGDGFSAEDVVWSADRLKNMPAGSVAGHLSTLESCTAIDANTIEMKFSEPNPMIFFDLAYLKIYSKAQAERDGENFYEKFVGTGPWKLQEWRPGESISFERNSEWWGTFADGAPTVVEHRPIPEESTRLAALLSGEIDLIPMVPVESQPLITETDYLYTESLSGINVVDLVMKNDKAPFNTTQMRQAMDLMVPREQIVSDLLGQGTPANIWSQSFYAWYPKEIEGVIKPYDVEQAKTLIAQSGYKGEEIRVMTRRGKSEKDVEICELLAGIWNQAGLNVTVQVVADAEFTERRASGDYEIYMTAWDINSPGFYYRDKYAAHNINRADVDPKFTELVEAVCAEMNIDEYNKKVAELELYLYEDPATLHLYYPAITWGAANRVQSFESVGGYIHLRLHNTVMDPAAR